MKWFRLMNDELAPSSPNVVHKINHYLTLITTAVIHDLIETFKRLAEAFRFADLCSADHRIS